MQEVITKNKKIVAIILRADYHKEGITFFTPDEFSQQLGYMKHPKGKIIEAHTHNRVKREVFYTQEVLFIKKGCLQVELYDDGRILFETKKLFSGDLILLASGGHGFKILEDTEMIEIKQGPHLGEADKTRF